MNYLEAIRIEQGVPLSLEYHSRRMLQTNGCTLPSLEIPSNMKEGRVKCRVVYNKEIVSIDYTPYRIPTIRSLKIVTDDTVDYASKYENRSTINRLFDNRKECDDILIVKNGLITDTSFCNIVFEKNETLYTPSTPLLAGTQRAKLIDHRIIHTTAIRPQDISKYDRAYLINAMISLEDALSVEIDNILP